MISVFCHKEQQAHSMVVMAYPVILCEQEVETK